MTEVLFLIDQVHAPGGLQRTLALRLKSLVSGQFKVRIIVPGFPAGAPFYDGFKGIEISYLNIEYDPSKALYSPRNIFRGLLHFKELWKLVEKENSCILINTTYGFETYFLPFIKLFAGTKIIHEHHCSRKYERKIGRGNCRKSLSLIVRTLFEGFYDLQVVLSVEESQEFPKASTVVIPNPGHQNSAVKKPQKKSGLMKQDGKLPVIWVGRIVPIKGLERLLKSWAILNKKKDHNAVLHIIGSGEPHYVKELEALVDQLCISKSVVFLGEQKNTAVLMAEAYLHVVTSHSECFPMSILEAMSAGVPTVAMDCDTGPRNLIAHGRDGLLVAEDESEFASAILRALANTCLRDSLSDMARRRAQLFSPEVVARKWTVVLQEISAG